MGGGAGSIYGPSTDQTPLEYFQAAAVLGLDGELTMLADDDATAEEARVRLGRVKIETVVGKLLDEISRGW
ncbi:MAG TPA: hypothetical protein VMH81_04550 [Bryobacteraceae bacterium]|nr:hypothetical protein [Bryobacteraceae bacterium]